MRNCPEILYPEDRGLTGDIRVRTYKKTVKIRSKGPVPWYELCQGTDYSAKKQKVRYPEVTEFRV